MYELFMNEKEQKHLRAELIFAKKLELIEDDTLNGVEDRRQKENQKREQMLQKSEIVYGPEQFSLPAYVRYEQTRFRLDFVQPSEKIKKLGVCPSFTREERLNFYENNLDLFGRYHGDYFPFEDVEQIIEKRLREEAYDKLIQNILCQSD